MHAASFRPPRAAPWPTVIHWIATLFLFMAMLLLAQQPAHAAAPPAGVAISNQASATYSDGSGVGRTVTSNLVQTTVTQVYSLTLVANGAQTATPGSVVYYPHTLTNTGNGSDTFALAAGNVGGSAFSLSAIEIYLDNGSGQPTGGPITSSGVVNAGATFKFIVRGTVPTNATAGTTNSITVTATSGAATTPPSASNTDVTTATGNAVIQLTKAISVSSGAPGTTGIQYTLTYTNNGNSTASNVKITDVLPLGMVMDTNSGRWSVTGTTALSMTTTPGSVGTAPNTLSSTYTPGTRTFEATISQVTAGQSGQVRFTVDVGAAVPPGVLNNTATVAYGNGGTPAATVTATSNTVPFTVNQTANVTFTGETQAGPGVPGSTLTFSNLLTNTGNGSDTFNVVMGSSNFPAGTTFQLYKSDGTTPLVDTNGDGTIDTGPLAAGGTYNVILKATLPPNATNAGAPFTVQKIARSALDNTKTATASDTLTAITAASVDLTNNLAAAAGVPGFGPGPEAAAQVTNTANPGTITVFTLFVKNTGPGPDSYNFSAGATVGMAALPTGWTVEFRTAVSGACTSTGTTITNSGSIASGGSAPYCAVVSVPAGYDAGDQHVYFRAQSPTSGVSDQLHDLVTVNAVRSVSLTPNGTGQTFPGGSYVFTHSLTNNGNVPEGGAFSTLTPAVPSSGGWSSTLYVDSNANGTLDAGDALLTGAFSGTLAKNSSITVFHRVIAPSGAVPGTVYAATITVTTANGSYITTVPAPAVATDSTTVIAGNLTLAKEQALDANCDGVADGGAGAYGQGNLTAKPGECVLYKVTVTNVGAADATNVVVSDATPTFTTLSALAATAAPGTIVTPALALGAAGTIKAHIGTGATNVLGGTLPAGQSAVITFGVKLNQ
jgi:uncharacterized repeat protein (TIGR01451 family)